MSLAIQLGRASEERREPPTRPLRRVQTAAPVYILTDGPRPLLRNLWEMMFDITAVGIIMSL